MQNGVKPRTSMLSQRAPRGRPAPRPPGPPRPRHGNRIMTTLRHSILRNHLVNVEKEYQVYKSSSGSESEGEGTKSNKKRDKKREKIQKKKDKKKEKEDKKQEKEDRKQEKEDRKQEKEDRKQEKKDKKREKKNRKRDKKRKKRSDKKGSSKGTSSVSSMDSDSDEPREKRISRRLLGREGTSRDICDMPPYCMGPCRSANEKYKLPSGLEVFGPPPPPLGDSRKKVRTQAKGEIAVLNNQKLCEMEPKCTERCSGKPQPREKRRVFKRFKRPQGDLTARISEICYSICRESCIYLSNFWHCAKKELTTFEHERLSPRLQTVLLQSLSKLTLPIEEDSPDESTDSSRRRKNKKRKRGKSSGEDSDSDSSTSSNDSKKKQKAKKKKRKKGKKKKGSKSETETTDTDYDSDSSSSKKNKKKKKGKKNKVWTEDSDSSIASTSSSKF